MPRKFAAFTTEELDAHADAFEALVIRGMREVVRESIERAYADGGVLIAARDDGTDPNSFTAFIQQLWIQFVATVLAPFLGRTLGDTATRQFSWYTDALFTGASADAPGRAMIGALIDQPLDTERYLQAATNRLVGIGDDLWDDARDQLVEGIDAGESIDDLAERVMTAVDVAEPRARMIARTEANGAMNGVVSQTNHRVGTMFDIDAGIMQEWSATHDLRTRPTHVAADGQVVQLGEPFQVGTASLQYPSDPDGPPEETINCRCSTLTVISDDVIRAAGGVIFNDEDDEPLTAALHAFHLPGKHNQKKHANRYSDGVQVRGIDADGRDVTSSRDDSSVVVLSDPPRVSDDERPAVNANYAKLVSEYSEYLGDVPEEQLDALEEFISLGYRRMQRTLREVNGDLSQVNASKNPEIFDLQELIDKAGPSNTRYTLYRGVRNLDDVIGTNEPPIGTRFVDTGFASTSTDLGVARAFTAHKNATTPTIIKIDAPVGTTFLPVQAPLSPEERDLTGEMEVLMPIGVEYEITGHTPGDQFTPGTLNVRIVGPSSVLTASMTSEELEDDYRRRLARNDDETRSTPVFLVTRVPDDVDSLTASAHREEEMPYDIIQGGGECAESEWAVVKQGTGESVGCHDTEESARQQVAAIMASEGDDADTTGTFAVDTETDAELAEATPDPHRFVPWSGVIAVEGMPTGDGRQFEHGALTWADLPMPLGWMYERSHGGVPTDKVTNVGVIDTIERGEGGLIVATGRIDLMTERGWSVAQMMGTRQNPGSLAGVSIDADDPDDPMQMNVEYVFPEECGVDDAGTPLDDNDGEEMDLKCMMPQLTIFKSGRIRAATMVDIPAFVEARIFLNQPMEERESELNDVVGENEDDVIIAASYTMTLNDIPPASWFEEPTDEPDIGAITVTDEGRIFGYLAPANVAHRGIREKRTTVPTGNVDYGIWMNRVTIADDGRGGFTRLATGAITMDCGHAPNSNRVTGAARQRHYDNSCSVVATARVGENRNGVWIAGAILPDVTADQVRRMMTLQLSGDWGPHREKPGKRELAAALLVPVPGFPKKAFTTMAIKNGFLQHVGVPLRFATTSHRNDERAFGGRAAIDQIARSVGRDRKSRVQELATRVRGS